MGCGGVINEFVDGEVLILDRGGVLGGEISGVGGNGCVTILGTLGEKRGHFDSLSCNWSAIRQNTSSSPSPALNLLKHKWK